MELAGDPPPTLRDGGPLFVLRQVDTCCIEFAELFNRDP